MFKVTINLTNLEKVMRPDVWSKGCILTTFFSLKEDGSCGELTTLLSNEDAMVLTQEPPIQKSAIVSFDKTIRIKMFDLNIIIIIANISFQMTMVILKTIKWQLGLVGL